MRLNEYDQQHENRRSSSIDSNKRQWNCAYENTNDIIVTYDTLESFILYCIVYIWEIIRTNNANQFDENEEIISRKILRVRMNQIDTSKFLLTPENSEED